MKANPGGVAGAAIIDPEVEIAGLWSKLQTRSVALSAERRVAPAKYCPVSRGGIEA